MMEWWALIMTTALTALGVAVGYLKSRDEKKFASVEEKLKLREEQAVFWREKIVVLEERYVELQADAAKCQKANIILQEANRESLDKIAAQGSRIEELINAMAKVKRAEVVRTVAEQGRDQAEGVRVEAEASRKEAEVSRVETVEAMSTSGPSGPIQVLVVNPEPVAVKIDKPDTRKGE